MLFKSLSRLILRNRKLLLAAFSVVTILMCWKATDIRLSYDFAKILPASDPDFIAYNDFKKTFGEDGSVMVLGTQDLNFFTKDRYNQWYDLGEEIRKMKGIDAVVSVTRLYNVTKNASKSKFDVSLIHEGKCNSQAEVDSVKSVLDNLPFYNGFIYNPETGAIVMAITFDNKELNSQNRIEIVKTIKTLTDEYSERNKTTVHLSGMPYIRTAITGKVVEEMKLFLGLAILITALVLFFFFRSFQVVFFSLIVVFVGVAWSLGSIALLGYKITILTGLIPPLIIVIGIPNSIFMLNKYQTEYARTRSQGIALAVMIKRIGFTTFLANVTTAIGFFVLYFTGSRMLMEFGMVAAINVMTTWVISLVLIPIVFSFLPPPALKQTQHLDSPRLNKILGKIDEYVRLKTSWIYITVLAIVAVSIFGMTKLNTVGFVVDDLPEKDPVYLDMRFFEKNFKGILPLEIAVKSNEAGEILKPLALQKINRLQKLLATYPEFSKSLSVVDGVKFSYQAFNDGNPKYYILPGSSQLAEMSTYLGDTRNRESMFKNFIDSSKTETRITSQMADIGSIKMNTLLKSLLPRIDSIFNKDQFTVKVTGNSLIFLKGNEYLFENLIESILLAIFLISIIMISLFMSMRMILISIIPSLIPLIITAGLMGFFNVALKPSTILIFSIAFGIASDQTIYFLTRYRHEIRSSKMVSISTAVSATIRETGVSMIYTAIILFCGFMIFSASGFGGTAALGKLLSVTLLLSMCSNLILLPAFLVSLERRITTKAFLSEPFFLSDAEDDDIDLSELTVQKNIDNKG